MNYYNETVKIEPSWKNLYNKAFCHLAQKQFRFGFELYENRLRNNNIHPHTKEKERVEIPMIPDWTGLDDDCEKLLVVYEQGIGDNIMFYRFAFELLALKPNMIIYYFCKENMPFLLKEYDNIKIITHSLQIMVATKKMYIMSFPFFLKIENIMPNKINYINVDDAKVIYWHDQLSNLKRPKIGFVNSGRLSSVFEKDIPLDYFESLTDLDADFICLSKFEDKKTKTNYIEKYNSKIHFYNIDDDKPFADTIAILQNIDLLITVDTAMVHIGGVMGIKTWLLLGFVSEWRWSNVEKSYWYDTVDILRVKEEKKHLATIIPIVKKKLMDDFLNK
jgi:ADP-heptose:LPS heptosyltransferase